MHVSDDVQHVPQLLAEVFGFEVAPLAGDEAIELGLDLSQLATVSDLEKRKKRFENWLESREFACIMKKRLIVYYYDELKDSPCGPPSGKRSRPNGTLVFIWKPHHRVQFLGTCGTFVATGDEIAITHLLEEITHFMIPGTWSHNTFLATRGHCKNRSVCIMAEHNTKVQTQTHPHELGATVCSDCKAACLGALCRQSRYSEAFARMFCQEHRRLITLARSVFPRSLSYPVKTSQT